MFGRDEKVSLVRLTAMQYIILGVFLLLAYGLWRLQVTSSASIRALAEKNRIARVPILAPRGKILDREGRVIVDNYPSFTALLLRDSSRDLTADADLIAQGLHLIRKMCAIASGNLPARRNINPSISKTTSLRRTSLHRSRIAMSCRSWTRSRRIAVSIRAMALWPT